MEGFLVACLNIAFEFISYELLALVTVLEEHNTVAMHAKLQLSPSFPISRAALQTKR